MKERTSYERARFHSRVAVAGDRRHLRDLDFSTLHLLARRFLMTDQRSNLRPENPSPGVKNLHGSDQHSEVRTALLAVKDHLDCELSALSVRAFGSRPDHPAMAIRPW